MYTILIKDTNELVATQKERIMKRSKLVDKLHFLMNPDYKGLDMTKFTATLEYVLPVSKDYKTETLIRSEELYQNRIEYVLPFDTNLTCEAGDIEIQITFTYVEMDEDGKINQYVRKISPGKITIVPTSAWSDIIPDDALTALDQRLLKADAMIQQLVEINELIDSTKADNIRLTDDNRLTLQANGEDIGNKILVGVPNIDESAVDEVVDGIIEI